jgi:hypothetical protein
VAWTLESFNVRSLKLWQATTGRGSMFRSKREARGQEWENRTEVIMAGRGKDKDRAEDNSEDKDRDRGEDVDRIFIQVEWTNNYVRRKGKRQNGGRMSPLMYIFSPSTRRC